MCRQDPFKYLPVQLSSASATTSGVTMVTNLPPNLPSLVFLGAENEGGVGGGRGWVGVVSNRLAGVKKHSTNYSRDNIRRVRKLRKDMSVSEQHLWRAIRRDQMGFRFRRQVPVGPYALDFYCAQASLCVEIDGEQHLERASADRRRDAYLLERGISTLRIPSLDLFDPTGVPFARWLRRIEQECCRRSCRE